MEKKTCCEQIIIYIFPVNNMCFTSWQHMFSLKMSQKSRELDLGVSEGQFPTCPNYCLHMDCGQMKSTFGKQLQRITKGRQLSLKPFRKVSETERTPNLTRKHNYFTRWHFQMNLYNVRACSHRTRFFC